MKNALRAITTMILVSAAVVLFSAPSPAAFGPQPGQTPPVPQNVPQQPQYPGSPLEGMWMTTGNNAAYYLLIAGNQYQLWLNNQMTESGTFSVQGNMLYVQPNGGQARAESFQLSHDCMMLMVAGSGGSVTYQKIQQNYPPQQMPPQQMPPQQWPPQQIPPQQTPPQQIPPQQTPPQNLQAQLQGTWVAYTDGAQAIFVFSGNQFAVSINNQTADYGTFAIQGNVIYYNSTTGLLKNPVLLQMAPDGRSMAASDTSGANPLMWQKIQ